MKLYVQTGITSRDLWHAEQRAEMTLANLRFGKSRHADIHTTVSFNGYGGATRSNRRPNERQSSGEYAATWDQWGILLSNLFAIDPRMKVGSYAHPYYDGVDDFHWQTFDRFKRVFTLSDLTGFHGDHSFRFSGVPGVAQCRKCPASRQWLDNPFRLDVA